jgi:hypothetical protein
VSSALLRARNIVALLPNWGGRAGWPLLASWSYPSLTSLMVQGVI